MTYRERYNKKYGYNKNASHSIKDISKDTGIKKSILQSVFNRGVGAWKTNIQSVRLKDGSKNYDLKRYPRRTRMTAEQWGYGRIMSFVMGGKTRYTADADLWKKHKLTKRK